MADISESYAKACVAVFRHLVRQIQDSADVRYFVGGPFSQMRELLVQAIAASGHQGDPLEVLSPPPHRANDETLHERLERRIAELGG